MSERRERCEEWVEKYAMTNRPLTPHGLVLALEAFAKQEQIKGMEAAREVCKKNADVSGRYLCALIDAAITKLKEDKP